MISLLNTFSMTPLAGVITQFLITVLVTDFITAVIHWLMDSYGNPNIRFIGPTVFAPNREHHHSPRAFVTRSWLKSASATIVLLIPIAGLIYLMGWFTWQVALSMFLLININHLHKITHRTPEENGWFFELLMKLGLIQTRRHHAVHHLDTQDRHYAALTNILNPMLDKIRFWRRLEKLIEATTGVEAHRYH